MSYLISGEGKSVIDTILGRDLAWVTRDAACRKGHNPDAFFPTLSAQSSRAAKLICAGCPLRVACAEYGLTHDVQGVWGGLTDYERRKIDRRQTVVCGTLSAYRRHLRSGQEPCGPCSEANTAHLATSGGAA